MTQRERERERERREWREGDARMEREHNTLITLQKVIFMSGEDARRIDRGGRERTIVISTSMS